MADKESRSAKEKDEQTAVESAKNPEKTKDLARASTSKVEPNLRNLQAI